MERKTKNIITISLIVILIIGIVLTIHFARTSGSKNFVNDRNIQMMDRMKKNAGAKEKANLPEDSEITPSDSTLKDKVAPSDNKDIDRRNARRNRPNGQVPSSFDKKNFKEMGNIQMPNRRGTFTTGYVVLLCAESFLLGGSIIYLVMNNIGDNEKVVEVVVKEEKEKKSKK